MLEDVPAPELHFVGLGAEGTTPAEATSALAQTLQDWCAAQENRQILKVSVLPLTPLAAERGYSATAIIVYRGPALLPSDAEQAVAAAVEEVHEAQTGDADPDLRAGT